MADNGSYYTAYEDLNPATTPGGPRLDASAPPRQDLDVRHRQRVVLSSDSSAAAVSDLVQSSADAEARGVWMLPVASPELYAVMREILTELKALNNNFATACGLLPPDREGGSSDDDTL